jgi:molybdopterin-guanine dinucleotide biosynthesis protein A
MGVDKAFVMLGGRPLIAHVLERLRHQASIVYVNVREDAQRVRALGCHVVLDAEGRGGAGPLAGLSAALRAAGAEGFEWLATAPCDAPFLPRNLVARLWARIGEGAPAAVAVSSRGLEPMFALWPTGARERVEAALDAGRASPRSVLAAIRAAETPFAEAGEDPFANINAPADLEAAEAALAAAPTRAIKPPLRATRVRISGDGQ